MKHRIEVWRDVPGYEGKYQVSNTGQVRSLNYMHTGKTKILKQDTSKRGYKRVILSKNGKVKAYSVHRLVAIAFIPNPNNWPQVNHKDENPANNFYKNLEWCTPKYNMNYGTRNERAGESMKGHEVTEATKKKISEAKKSKNNPNSKVVLMFSKNDEFIQRFDCVADANEFLGKPRNNSNIYLCTIGINKTAYGYKWKRGV